MAIPKHHIGFEGDECQCGRRASLRHCLTCGSSRVYARQRQIHKFKKNVVVTTNGVDEVKEVEEPRIVDNQYRCQTCGRLFVEEERPYCDAPPVGNVLAIRRLKVLNAASKLDNTDKRVVDALASILTKHPATPVSADDTYTPSATAEAFRTLVFQHKQVYLLLKEENRLIDPSQTMTQYLEQWIAEEGITIPEGESLE